MSPQLTPLTGVHSKPALRRFDRTLVALVNRVTQGFTLEEYDLAASLGYQGYLDHHLAPESIDDSAIQPYLDGLVTLWLTPKEAQELAFETGAEGPKAPLELQGAAAYRSLNSKRQLFERVVEFWTDHFNVNIQDKSCWALKPTDDRDVIRPNAFGTFHDLLNASAHSGAMLFYLDNYANWASAPQENYGREIMELHSLGVNGGYTEADVKEVSRCFTGWSLYSQMAAQFGQFFYNPANHDTNEKVVLGNVIPAGGQEADGLQVIDILSSHPSTAEFVGRKLASWLLVHQPSQELVDQVAQKFLATGGDVKAMIRVILRKKNLVAAEPWNNPKLKRPFHFAISLMRALGVEIDYHGALIEELELLGMRPFTFPPPTGFPDSPQAWGSQLHPRWTFANRLLVGAIPGLIVDQNVIMERLASTGFGALPQQINALLTGGQMNAFEVGRVQAYLDTQPILDGNVLGEAITLAASSPTFQLY